MNNHEKSNFIEVENQEDDTKKSFWKSLVLLKSKL